MMLFKSCKHMLDETDDEKIRNLGKDYFSEVMIRTFEKENEINKYFHFKLDEDIMFVFNICLSFDFDLETFTIYEDRVHVWASLFLLHKGYTIPRELTNFFVKEHKEVLQRIADEIIFHIEHLYEKSPTTFTLRIKEDLTHQLQEKTYQDKEEKMRVWKLFNELQRANWLPPVQM